MVRSTYPGGAADKAGNNHEALWGVYGILDVLEGKASGIRIEAPGEDGAEFFLQKGVECEFWQAKRQLTDRETWTIAKLKEEKVLDYFYSKYLSGHRYVFASISDAPALGRLRENAEAANSFSEFSEHFLNKQRNKDFSDLLKVLKCDAESLYQFLRKLKLPRCSEDTLEDLLTKVLGYRYNGNPKTIMVLLRDLYLQSIHETLTEEGIENYLSEHGIKPRERVDATSRECIESLTNGYVEEQRSKLISQSGIPRELAKSIVKRISDSQISVDVLITSAAGGGKSACLLQIVEGLRNANVPVLAFRLDRVKPEPSTIALGAALGLAHSPAVVLSEAYQGQPVVLVVDQVDCVSTSSGRRIDFFDTLAALRKEVVSLRGRSQVHIALACRRFDFEHDYRLKQLLPKQQEPEELKLLTEEEVKAALTQHCVDSALLSGRQLNLLKLPQNLSLYLQSSLRGSDSKFATQKELFDAYWLAKREAVCADDVNFDQYWMPIITHLASKMNQLQELSVLERELDGFPPAFVRRMTSEGVLTREQNRYGFSHESFFDYCFARTQPNGGREFVEFLENDTQKLFRRAQLRQVLVFLRDDDFDGYQGCMDHLLKSEKIRPHLKLSAIDLLCSNSEPKDQELEIMMPWINAQISHFKTRTENRDKLGERIWNSFFTSRSLFPIADRAGYVDSWLNSGDEILENVMANYLRWQTERHAGRVAELLEPFVNRSKTWNLRLRNIMEWGNQGKDRRLFDLFLRLLDEGILDEARGLIATNASFWSMLHGFAEERPDWCSELAAHWLDRQVTIIVGDAEKVKRAWSNIRDQFGADDVLKCAKGAPLAYLRYVLPSILRAAQAFPFNSDRAFPRDSLWPSRHIGENDFPDTFLVACETAFLSLAEDHAEKLCPYIESLKSIKLYTTNHLLLFAYKCAPIEFADEALDLLVTEPGRLHCGYNNSAYWLTRELIEACSPYASNDTILALERLLLSFVSPCENTQSGFKFRGQAAHSLLSAIPHGRLSLLGKSQLGVWNEKFQSSERPPKPIKSYTVVSPIGKSSADHMTDGQWLKAIAKYNTEDRHYDWDHPEKGGGWQLASLLESFVKEEPRRFAKLCLRFPDDTLANYYSSVLSGIKESNIDVGLKLQVVLKAKGRDAYGVQVAALDMLGAIEGERLPREAIDYIIEMAGHSDPEPKAWEELESENWDVLNRGLNSVRGRVADSVRNLIFEDAYYWEVFEPIIQQLSNDPSLSVRAMVASTVHAVANVNEEKAISLFLALLDKDLRLTTSNYVGRFMRWSLNKHFPALKGTIEEMLNSQYDDVREEGGIIASLAFLYHEEAKELSDYAFTYDTRTRLGLCKVAADNILYPECLDWCLEKLPLLFNDDSDSVQKQAAECFRKLWKSPDTPLEEYHELIEAFRTSRAFEADPTMLLYVLESTRQRVPHVALAVCEEFVRRCAEQSKEISSSMSADEHTVGKIVFTVYAQLHTEEQQVRALNLIDAMCLEGLNSAQAHLSEIER